MAVVRRVGFALLSLACALSVGCTADSGCEPVSQEVRVSDWHVNSLGLSEDLHAISLLSGEGWVVGDAGTAGWTADGGETWDFSATPLVDSETNQVANVRGVVTAFDLPGLVVGDGGAIFSGARQGFAFTQVASGTTADLRAIAANETDIAVAGDGVLLWSTNRGTSFTLTEVEGSFFALSLANSAHAWAVGAGGVVYRGDATGWTSVNIGTTSDLTSVTFIDEADGMIAGPSGVWITADGGITWTTPAVLPAEPLETLLATRDDYLAVDASGAVIRSEDRGETWVTLYQSGVAGLNSLVEFEDSSMPNSQYAAAGPTGQVLVYGTRFVTQDVTPDWGECP